MGYNIKGRKLGVGEKPEIERKCIIHGLRYVFTGVHEVCDELYGYCPRTKKWVEIHDKYVVFEGEPPIGVDKWL